MDVPSMRLVLRGRIRAKIEDKLDKRKLTRKDCSVMDLVDEIDGMDDLEQAMLEELMLLGWNYAHSPLY